MARKFLVPVRFAGQTTDPAGTGAGDVYYNTSSGRLMMYNGSTWAVASNVVPAGGLEGQILSKTTDTDYALSWIDNTTEDLQIIVKNDSGVTISKGMTVMAVGAVGDRIQIAKANADGSIEARYMLGIAAQDITNGSTGYVDMVGSIKNLDTSAWAVGTVLYFHPSTPGALTSTKPSAPALIISAAIVTNSHATNGRLFVRMWEQGTVTGGGSGVTSVNGLTGAITATNLLDAIKTVDGAGSGLDADTLDGNSSAAFATSGHTHTYAPNAFSTIAISGQTSVVADGTADTLTLVAGTNVTLTTDAATDTITINAAAGGSGNSFTTIATTSGTSPVADSSTDTLNLTAGTGISVTGDSTTDTVTFANTGVTSLAGTTNRVTVSGSTGSVTLNLPQDIHTGANPTFAGLTADTVRIGITAANEIDTTSGNLVLDSASGQTDIQDNVSVTGSLGTTAALSAGTYVTSLNGNYYGPNGGVTNAPFVFVGATSLNINNGSGDINLQNPGGRIVLGNQSATSGKEVVSSSIYNTTAGTGTTLVITTTSPYIIRRTSSSMRYKDNISDIVVPDEDILSLRPIKYSDKSDVEEFGDNARLYFGFIAEEVVEKESLRDLVMFDDEGKPESLMYDRIVPLLVQVCKNQRTEIDLLKARLDAAGL